MNKHLKAIFIVVPICFALAGLSVLLYLIDPEFVPDAYHITSMVLVTVWAFFIVPAFPFTIGFARSYFERMTFEQSFRFGYLLGCGWGTAIILFFIIVSPVSGTMWFTQEIKAAKQSAPSEQPLPADDKNDDVFDV